MAHWVSWEEQDRDHVALRWVERGITVVFPRDYARARTHQQLAARAKARIAEVETKAQRVVVSGSVLVAFSKHEDQPVEHMIDPMAPRDLLRSTM